MKSMSGSAYRINNLRRTFLAEAHHEKQDAKSDSFEYSLEGYFDTTPNQSESEK